MIVLSGQFTYMRKKEDPIVRKFILSAQRFFVNLNISGEKLIFSYISVHLQVRLLAPLEAFAGIQAFLTMAVNIAI